MPRRDKIDWKDDLLSGIELAIVIILAFMFFQYIQSNEAVMAVLQPETVGMFVLTFGLFIGAFLFVKWLNREKV